MMGWAAALCLLLAAVVALCIAFLAYDSYKHREPKRKPMATPVSIDELQLRRLKKAVAIRIGTIKQANGK